MRRSSISGLMALVALLAADFAVIRVVLVPFDDMTWVVLGSLFPLVNALLAGLHFLVTRYRLTVRRREGRQRFAPAFVVASSLGLVVALCAGARFPFHFMGLIADFMDGIDWFLNAPEAELAFRIVLICVATSGPALLFALVAAVIFGRFTVVVTPREEPPV
jgi:hypothetical protein